MFQFMVEMNTHEYVMNDYIFKKTFDFKMRP